MTQNQTADSVGLSRRSVLKAGALAPLCAGAVAPAAAWRTSAPSHPVAAGWAGLRQPGSLPYPKRPEGTDTLPQIDHIIVMMMENHSYDNRLGMLRRFGADGFRLDRSGNPVATPVPGRAHPACVPDADHVPVAGPSRTGLGGQPHPVQRRPQRRLRAVASGPVAMGYWQPEDQPFYASLASIFPLADRYFASVPGQTFPNRRFLMAATSFGRSTTLPNTDHVPTQRHHLRPARRARHHLEDYLRPGQRPD